MRRLWQLFRRQYLFIRNSIAFYPSIIAIGYSVFGVIFLLLEESYITAKILDKLPILIIEDPDTARSILNTMIGGIISLMVFSFSMVMILLNQASSNYSPRLLPGLITNKRHQIVLGVYLGTILFCILCSINVLPGGDTGQMAIPSLSVLLGIILSIICLGMFIYFIHSISDSIQISNIIKKLYDEGKADLEKLKKSVLSESDYVPELIHEIRSIENGYLIGVSEEALRQSADALDLRIEVVHPLGLFVMEGELVLRVSRPLDESTSKLLLNCLHYNVNESVSSSHFSVIKNITEVALKAMSPGINDPGTALLAINYLILLLSKRMEVGDIIYIQNEKEDTREASKLYQRLMPFDKLIFYTLGELRTYVAHDQLVVSKVLEGLDYLMTRPAVSDQYYQIVEQEKKVFIKVSKEELQSDHDIYELLN